MNVSAIVTVVQVRCGTGTGTVSGTASAAAAAAAATTTGTGSVTGSATASATATATAPRGVTGGGCPWIALGIEIDPAMDTVQRITHCSHSLFFVFLAVRSRGGDVVHVIDVMW